MFVVDTDTLTLLHHGHEQVTRRMAEADRDVVTTIITRIELIQGRFDALIKAETGDQLVAAFERLARTEANLSKLPILPIDARSAVEFDKLRHNKKLKKIGRADLLIASIALAHGATVVTRNLKHFRIVPGLRLENWVD